jgi:hypothetical protein
MIDMADIGDRLVEDRRQRDHTGDFRLSPEGREALLRLVTGDRADEFAAALAEGSDADPLLAGGDHDGGDAT